MLNLCYLAAISNYRTKNMGTPMTIQMLQLSHGKNGKNAIPEPLSREISWLQFNARVLQEADDARVPLIERCRFLGIYSSNMDEFYRVRVPALSRFLKILANQRDHDAKQAMKEALENIHAVTVAQQKELERIFKALRVLFAEQGLIFHEDRKLLTEEQRTYVERYFREEVGPAIMPIWMKGRSSMPILRDRAIYFVVQIKFKKIKTHAHAMLRVPTHMFSRFVVLPKDGSGSIAMMLLDDLIRLHLDEVFRGMEIERLESYEIKVTRDSELALEEERDMAHSYTQQIEKSLKKRKYGAVTRLVYDSRMPESLLQRVCQCVGVNEDTRLIPGGRYHNFRDWMKFPSLGRTEWLNPALPALSHPVLESAKSFLKVVQDRDILLHFPYQRFSYVIDVLREAALDPYVHTVKITLYRMADTSHVVNVLRSAVHNGKRVLVIVELQARFDEENNLYWAKKFQEEGVEVIFGVPGLKVHSKLFLIERRVGKHEQRFAYIGTGNFNENTAKVYTDCAILTAHHEITKEVFDLFEFFQVNYHVAHFKHLLVAPFYMRERLRESIDREIGFAHSGREAAIDLKLNNLNDPELIEKLYEASQAGVRVRIIVRSVSALVPGIKGLSKNIQVISIVDRFLEHSRLIFFYNGGKERAYLSSGDWMIRNLDHRVEVACPILDESIRQTLKQSFDYLWSDTQKARILDPLQQNHYRSLKNDGFLHEECRGQMLIYESIKSQLNLESEAES